MVALELMHILQRPLLSFHPPALCTKPPSSSTHLSLSLSLSTNMGEGTEVDLETGSKYKPMRKPRKGGFRATRFIFVMSALESVGFVAIMVSLVLYFLMEMHLDLSGAATTTTNFMGATFLLTILGGFISDTYVTRLNTVLIFGLIEILGYILLTLQAHNPKLHPDPNNPMDQLHGSNARLLYITLCLLALGAGGIRGSLPALGADQFDKNHPTERKHLASFFNWLLLSITLGASVGVTVIVWVGLNKSWAVGFFVSMLLAVVGFGFVAVGKPFYRVRVPGDSPLLRVLQVIVVTIRNRKLSLPDDAGELHETIEKGDGDSAGEKIAHTNQFRCLDRAAVLPRGGTTAAPRPWRVCSVTQVEEFKILTRMLPILFSTIVMNTCLAQLQTFSVGQGRIMDLHLLHGRRFEVPPASIPVIPLVFMSLLIPIYEFVFVPFARRITGIPTGITHLQRVGVGLVLSAVSMAVAAVIEVKRRDAFNHDGVQISLFWLSFQYAIFGIADMFTFIGLMEFFYSEAPSGMRSLSTSLSFLSLSLGYFLSSVFVDVINAATAGGGRRVGWLHGTDLNANHLDRFYWFLAALSCANFANYLFWANWYGKYKIDTTTTTESQEKAGLVNGGLMSPVLLPNNGDDDNFRDAPPPHKEGVEASSSTDCQGGADKREQAEEHESSKVIDESVDR